MPVEYTRDPDSLSYDDYKYWIRKEVLKFCVDHEGDSDFPSHIVPDIGDFETMIDAYDAAFNPYHTLIDLANKKNKSFSDAAKAMTVKLQQIKYAIPTIDPDPVVLAEFDLGKEIPNDRDLLMTVAENALSHWGDVSGEPKFGPIVGDFDALQTLYDDCVAKQDAYVDTEDQRQATQNAVLATREALHVVERQVFNWYRSRHPNGQDEFWTNSPWGRTSGGGTQPGPEPPENWDEAPTGFTVTKSIGNSIEIFCVIHPDADGVNIYHAEGPFGVDMVPARPGSPAWEAIEALPLMVDVAYAVRHWIWVCAVKDGVEGDFAGPLWIEFKEVPA